jgi:gliding motility-associated-like protein
MKFCLQILCFVVLSAEIQAQTDVALDDFDWLVEIVDSIEQSDICLNCQTPPSINSYYTTGGLLRFRLRYACTPLSSVTKFYELDGALIGSCVIDTLQRECMAFAAETSYTFGKNIQTIWTCDQGFDCDTAPRSILFPGHKVNIAPDPCDSGARILSLDSVYAAYQWTNSKGIVQSSSSLNTAESGVVQLIITNAMGCKDTSMIEVDIDRALSPTISGTTTICDQSIGVGLSLSGYNTYLWSNGATTSQTQIFEAGHVSVIATTDMGCIDTLSTQIEDASLFSVEISTSHLDIFEGQEVELSFNYNYINELDITEVRWIESGREVGNTPIFKMVVNQDAIIEIEVTTKQGCIYSDQLEIIPLPVNRNIYFPNVINPNSTFGNDRFYPQTIAGTIEVRELQIFDRWGSMIYFRSNVLINQHADGWDGTLNGQLMPIGTYIYMAEVVYGDGSSDTIVGDISLLY